MSSTRVSERPLAWLVIAAVVIGVLTTVVAFIGVIIGLATGGTNASAMVVTGALLRTVLCLAVVFGVIWFATKRAGGALPDWLVAAGVGYLLNPFAWGGNALFTATLLGGAQDQPLWARLIGFVVDLAIWAAVALVAARRGLAAPRALDVSGLR